MEATITKPKSIYISASITMIMFATSCAVGAYRVGNPTNTHTCDEVVNESEVTRRIKDIKLTSRFTTQYIDVPDGALTIKEIVDHHNKQCYLLFSTFAGTAAVSTACTTGVMHE
jgi:hypothetical protein